MEDLEICKRIAKIEGIELIESQYTEGRRVAVKHKHFNPRVHADFYRNVAIEDEYFKYNNYNPLTDDALCFRLMIKHNIKLSRNRDKKFVAMWSHCRGEENESPNKAICLAIIEANKEK